MLKSQTDHPSYFKWEHVKAYAETRSTKSLVGYPQTIEDCIKVLEYCNKNGLTICIKGGGFTFADMILNHGQVILDMTRMNKIHVWDMEMGQMVVDPGVRFSDIFCISLIDNWTLNSCPGGSEVTIGGAVSNNVHGKDSWNSGNFGDQVIGIKLLTANGDVITVNRKINEKLFNGIVGGMGLLGIITEITLQLQKIPSPFVKVSSFTVRNVNETVEILENNKKNNDFSVAWVDAFAKGSNMGRGFVTTAKWIDSKKKLPKQRLIDSLKIPTRIFGILPARPIWFLARPIFRPWAIRYVNELNYLISSHGYRKKEKCMLYTDYNFMTNKIPDLKHVYRPQGFLEFEPLIPKSNRIESIKELFRLCQHYKCQSLLCAMKSHKVDDYMISYSADGYSIGIDIQIAGRSSDQIRQFSNAIYNYTLECGGKIFLAKDELLPADVFKQMYPRYKEFLELKKKVDPNKLFQSDMYRRLFI